MLEKILENTFDCKEIHSVHPKGNQSWIFIGRTDAESETPLLWPPNAKNWLLGEDPDAGRDSGQEEKGTTEDEMVGWHHRLDGHEFEQALGVGDGQGSLAVLQSMGSQRVGYDWAIDWNSWGYHIPTSVSEYPWGNLMDSWTSQGNSIKQRFTATETEKSLLQHKGVDVGPHTSFSRTTVALIRQDREWE